LFLPGSGVLLVKNARKLADNYHEKKNEAIIDFTAAIGLHNTD